MSKIKYICIHHSAVSKYDIKKQFNAVNRYHKQKWEMKSTLGYYVGYNYFIEPDGTTTQARAIGEETMAVIGHNHDSIHICLAGDFNDDCLSMYSKQAKSLVKLIKELQSKYLVPIKLHRELQKNRTCPGYNLNENCIINIVNIDLEDIEKQEKIKELNTLLGRLKALLVQLMLKYESRNN